MKSNACKVDVLIKFSVKPCLKNLCALEPWNDAQEATNKKNAMPCEGRRPKRQNANWYRHPKLEHHHAKKASGQKMKCGGQTTILQQIMYRQITNVGNSRLKILEKSWTLADKSALSYRIPGSRFYGRCRFRGLSRSTFHGKCPSANWSESSTLSPHRSLYYLPIKTYM